MYPNNIVCLIVQYSGPTYLVVHHVLFGLKPLIDNLLDLHRWMRSQKELNNYLFVISHKVQKQVLATAHGSNMIRSMIDI
jgi:hypothetical protein